MKDLKIKRTQRSRKQRKYNGNIKEKERRDKCWKGGMCLYLYETRRERRNKQKEEQNVKEKNRIKEKDATKILIMTLLMFTLLIITVLKTLNKGDFTNNAYFTYNDFN